MEENIACGFCGKEMQPSRDEKEGIVRYWCTECNSLLAAYARKYEDDLVLGKMFQQHKLWQYEPKPPPYLKKVADNQ